MNTILSFFTLLGCLTIFLSSLFRYRYSHLVSAILFFVSVILLCIVNSRGIHIGATLFIGLVYTLFLYEGKIIEILEHFILYCFFLFFSYIAGNSIVEMFNFNDGQYTLIIIISTLLTLYMSFSYTRIYELFKEVNLPAYGKYIIAFPVGSVLFIPFLTLIPISFILILIVITILLVIALSTELIYIHSVQALNRDHEKKLQRYMETSSQNKYDLLNQQYQNSFNLLHELMHKCNELVILMKNKKYEKVEDELTDITNATFKEFNEIYSNSVVFNTLLSNRKSFLQEYNISIKSTIEFNNFDFISFSNQVDLFNTLLDFILEEARLSKTNKIVFIKSTMVAGQVILSFRFANNHNKNLEDEVNAALSSILNNYEAILSVNEIDENTASLLLLFPKQK